ncbi:alpha-amylase [Lacticigenium naphthae]|uniref:alpha-amylase n=1 Tax=Lacticigenium naphthae TaxID=515351 RepID=UPI0003FCD760|nr:alpha-amylase [Lacticigenium naphthae]
MGNGTMMQYFEWYLENDGKHWQRLKDDAIHLKEMGITAVWIPPCFKSTSTDDAGYGIYDLYDLGEFDQKGSVRTKYGTKEELIEAIKALHEQNIHVYADVVLNHKAGADGTEKFYATEVSRENRKEEISDPHEIEGWTFFDFPGRDGKYSDFEWHWYHFSGVDYDDVTGDDGIFRIEGEGKGWAPDESVGNEFGNYDYLMFADIDYGHPEVVEETKKWISWFIKETGIDGIRLDAVKHIRQDFIHDLVEHVRAEFGEEFFFVAEYWEQDPSELEQYLQGSEFKISLMDVRFHYALSNASKKGNEFSLPQLFDGTLYKEYAEQAVTFVDNHDSQPGQSLESPVDDWFKPIAYGVILLSSYGYPTVFYGDYYGLKGPDTQERHQETIDKLLKVRCKYAYGEQTNYLNHTNCIGFTRSGDEQHPEGCAVVLSNSEEGFKNMFVGEENAGKIYYDYLGHHETEIEIDESGKADFPVSAGSISVWIKK